MQLSIKSPREFINPLLSKRAIDGNSLGKFKQQLNELFKVNKNETEEHQKNAVRDFLNNAFGYKINTKDKIDWAIFVDDKIEVIIESKRTLNDRGMISADNCNCRAMHEVILYYSREKSNGTTTIRHIIIQTMFDWYVFDAKEFNEKIIDNTEIKKLFKSHNAKIDDNNSTTAFYSGVEKILNDSDINIACAHFHLDSDIKENEVRAIYKLLSPDCLLKQFNPNDANSLNRGFYNELLYILGLEETKQGGKKLIGRVNENQRQQGSLFENIAHKLSQYGKPTDFESVIRLIIIWINRLLFLKLLESQIVAWSGNNEYKFLYKDKISQYDQLEDLFFEILAKKVTNRTNRNFDYIPYLNSSLFEIHADEKTLIAISNLSDDACIEYFGKTVAKNNSKKAKTGSVNTLEYLFEFLDAYDFSNDSKEEVITEQKSLINASVLGLIFEKINGYKDGSFYTPSFITMYMARESVTKAVIDKFNTTQSWECKTLVDVHNAISDNKLSKQKANDIINSITICDPAVGSGHFLVSALNELIYIKNELGVLIDHSGKKLECEIKIQNDELIVTLDNGDIFSYENGSGTKTKIQKTLFHEKQTIIENCLFGVDINPNSVNICRLRLWIELLKNAYYKEDGTLETLPNIDINIKCGNSLISRFGLKDDIKDKKIKEEIERYKQVVKDYKENVGNKHEVMASIDAIKAKFSATMKVSSKATKNLDVKLKEWVSIFGYKELDDDLMLRAFKANQHDDMFGVDESIATKFKGNQKKMLEELKSYQREFIEFETGKIYDNAFEWRFEFPEVLDENGDYIGFDVVIGNPPYIDSETMSKHLPVDREYYSNNFETTKGNWDLFIPFIEQAHKIKNTKGLVIFITPNKWLSSPYAIASRGYYQNNLAKLFDYSSINVFDEASISAIVPFFYPSDTILVRKYIDTIEFIETEISDKNQVEHLSQITSEHYHLINKIRSNNMLLEEFYEVFDSATTADAYRIKEFINEISDEKNALQLKLVTTGTVQKYTNNWGVEPTSYLKNKYHKPCINKTTYEKEFHNKSKQMLKPKLIVTGMRHLRAFFDEDVTYLAGKTTRIIIAKKESWQLKVLLSIINSYLLTFYMVETFKGGSMGGGINISPELLRSLPIPAMSENSKTKLIELSTQTLTAKKSNPKADTSALENQIDQMVYKLYKLTYDEVKVIAPEFSLSPEEYEAVSVE